MDPRHDRRAPGLLARLRRLLWTSGYCRECHRLTRARGPLCAACASDAAGAVR